MRKRGREKDQEQLLGPALPPELANWGWGGGEQRENWGTTCLVQVQALLPAREKTSGVSAPHFLPGEQGSVYAKHMH